MTSQPVEINMGSELLIVDNVHGATWRMHKHLRGHVLQMFIPGPIIEAH